MLIRFFRYAWLAAVLSLGFAAQASAITTTNTRPFAINYIAAFTPQFMGGYPYSGNLHVVFRNGIISGSYRDTSVKPGAPFSIGNEATIAGGTDGTHVHFSIGGVVSVVGQMSSDASTISGTMTWRKHLYAFLAKRRPMARSTP